MRTRLKRAAIAGLAAVTLTLPLAARADDDEDHDLARDLREEGEIRALSEILRTVSGRVPGDIVAIDLVKQSDKWVYRFQVVSADGRRTTVDVDASVGTLIHSESGD